jgi:hypothetical protein
MRIHPPLKPAAEVSQSSDTAKVSAKSCYWNNYTICYHTLHLV